MTISPFSTTRIHFSTMDWIIFKLLIALVFLAAGCSDFHFKDDKEYLLLCYNKAFGQRFSLPQDKAIDLSNGLLAIGFGQSKRIGMRLYLYLDSSLDIFSPKECDYFCGHDSDRYFPDINKKDQSFRWGDFVKESNRILMQSKSFKNGKDGFVSSASHAFIEKDALPGITLVAVNGFISPIFDCEFGPIEILIQKNNTGDSIFWENGPVDDTRVFHFDIPDKLIKAILKHLKEEYERPAIDPIDVYYP